jgi:SAM-dependent methyltransferase
LGIRIETKSWNKPAMSGNYTSTFYEGLRTGAERSAEAIVPLVVDLFHPRGVVDVGCGDGSWLAVFRKLGVQNVLGIDGDYVERGLLRIPQEHFQAADLSRPLVLPQTFDLAVSLEVAEHLPEECAAVFIESLTRLAPVILFSAAIPFQGGVHHVNEQWPDKWGELFQERDYLPIDCIRKRIWQNDAVDWWYAQNILVFAHETFLQRNALLKAEFDKTNLNQLRLVHPRNYLDAFVPVQAPAWSVGTASQLLRVCLRNAIVRRLYALVGKKTRLNTTQNPANFNSVLQKAGCYGIVRRFGRD